MNWLLLDYGGVIANDHCDEAESALADLFGVSRERLRSATTEKGELGKNIRLNRISDLEFWTSVCEELTGKNEMPCDVQKLTHLWASTYEVRNQVVDLIKAMQLSGYQVVIATNCDKYREEHMRMALDSACLLNYSIFSSWRIGHMKPAEEFFISIANQIDLKRATSIIFADDRQEHVDAASRLGWNTVKYESFSEFYNTLQGVRSGT